MIAQSIQGQTVRLPIRVLMDPGSDFSYIHERVIPKGAVPKITVPLATSTLSGTTAYDRVVELSGIQLPEFSRSMRINRLFRCYVSNQKGNTDLILGNDFLTAVGVNCNGEDQTMSWIGNSIPYKPPCYFHHDNKELFYTHFLEDIAPMKL